MRSGLVRTFECATYLNNYNKMTYVHAGEIFANYSNPAMDKLLDEAVGRTQSKRIKMRTVRITPGTEERR